jgi:hypothetical protein
MCVIHILECNSNCWSKAVQFLKMLYAGNLLLHDLLNLLLNDPFGNGSILSGIQANNKIKTCIQLFSVNT